MSFFKRLKDKLMGNPAEEEKLEAVDKEQESVESELEESNEPAVIETVDVEVPEQVEESPAMEMVKEAEVEPSFDIEEEQAEIRELAVIEDTPVEEKSHLLGLLHKNSRLVLKKRVIPLLPK